MIGLREAADRLWCLTARNLHDPDEPPGFRSGGFTIEGEFTLTPCKAETLHCDCARC